MERDFRRFTICGYDRAFAPSSGTGVGLVSLACWLAGRGISVQVLVIYSGSKLVCPHVQALAGIEGVQCDTLSMDEVPYAVPQTRWILDRVQDFRPDVFCANYVAPGIFAARNLGLAGVPVVVVLHSTGIHYTSILSCLESGYLDPPPFLVAVSRHIADKLVGKFGDLGVRDATVISCGTPVPDRFISNAPNPVIRVLYAGRFIDQGKRISDVTNAMIAVCASVDSAHCALIGDGPAWESVREHVRLNDHTQRVEVLPAMPNARLKEQLHNAHAFLLLSEYEGLPVALMEAMAAGLVPIGPEDVPGISEVIRSGENGILVTDRIAGVVSAVRELVENPGLWRKLSKQARSTVIEQYAIDAEGEKWLELCTKLSMESHAWGRMPYRRIRLPEKPLFEGDRRMPPLKQRVKAKVKGAVMAARLTLRPRTRIRALRNRWGS